VKLLSAYQDYANFIMLKVEVNFQNLLTAAYYSSSSWSIESHSAPLSKSQYKHKIDFHLFINRFQTNKKSQRKSLFRNSAGQQKENKIRP